MPSFQGDDNGTTLSASPPTYELPSHLRQDFEKPNGYKRSSPRTSRKGSLDKDPDYLVNGNTGEKPINANFAHINGGDGNYESGLNSLPNGRSSGSSWDHKSAASRNGSSLSINGAMNGGMDERGRKSIGSQHGHSRPRPDQADRASIVSMPQAPIDSPKPVANEARKISVPPPIPTNPQSTGPLTYSSSLVPATPGPDTPDRSQGPHRFSSPPTYPSSSSSTPAASSSVNSGTGSSSLQPAAPLPQLKHRHTLEVPKVSNSRGSRDYNDQAVTASGRFSPTAQRRGSMSINRRATRSIHSDMPHEEVPQDEDAARWAEAIRQKRASKRKRRDDEEDDRVVVGTKVDQNHVNWVTAYNMLTGIRFTVSRTNAKLDRALTDADFDAKHKFSFDITGNELTPSAKYDFKFKDYAPWVFRSLRSKFKLDPADYLMSLTSKYILSELGSPGKSGSFFYFSRDYKYIIKTIHHAEHKFLRKILKDYYNHVENNPNTLLSQFYGLHRVKIPYGRKIHFVVMNNLFPPHRDIHQTFDLKGSTIGRDFKEEDLEKNPRATLKDLNWLRRNLHLEFGPEKKRMFIEQMERDVVLLQKLKIMDYSMLVGIHDLERGNQDNLRDKTLQVFQPGGDKENDDPNLGPNNPALMRTPSKMENARKARELRQIIKQEKPIPMGQSKDKMPDEMEENITKRDFYFYSDDGGFQATHDDNRPGDEIYYLGIIDCLTHYGMVKKLENFWKGLSHEVKQISPIAPEGYGDRFIKFITGITKTREEAEREAAEAEAAAAQEAAEATSPTTGRKRSGSQNMHRTYTDNTVIQRAESQAATSEQDGAREEDRPERTLMSVRSSSAERGQGTVLPVVEEAGEASSTGGKSGEVEDRPPTPAKDYANKSILGVKHAERRPPTPPKDYNGNLTPADSKSIRSVRSVKSVGSLRSWKDKDLPSVPGENRRGRVGEAF